MKEIKKEIVLKNKSRIKVKMTFQIRKIKKKNKRIR